LSGDPAACHAAKSACACALLDGPLGGMSPPSHVNRSMSLPIQWKQELALLHWLCLWQLPSQSPIVEPEVER
jgi:hypothetical protein